MTTIKSYCLQRKVYTLIPLSIIFIMFSLWYAFIGRVIRAAQAMEESDTYKHTTVTLIKEYNIIISYLTFQNNALKVILVLIIVLGFIKIFSLIKNKMVNQDLGRIIFILMSFSAVLQAVIVVVMKLMWYDYYVVYGMVSFSTLLLSIMFLLGALYTNRGISRILSYTITIFMLFGHAIKVPNTLFSNTSYVYQNNILKNPDSQIGSIRTMFLLTKLDTSSTLQKVPMYYNDGHDAFILIPNKYYFATMEAITHYQSAICRLEFISNNCNKN